MITSAFQRDNSAPSRPDARSTAVIVNGFQQSWMPEICQTLNRLCGLKDGWDGYKGVAVKFDCAMFAVQLLSTICDSSIDMPSIVPGSDGTLQVEWHYNQFDIEVDILAPYEVYAYRHDIEAGTEIEIPLTSDFSILKSWVDKLRPPPRLRLVA